MLEWLEEWPKGEPVPAISIRQPFAGAVTWLGKNVENRSKWQFGHRGPILIHAGQTPPCQEDAELVFERVKDEPHDPGFLELWDPSGGKYDQDLQPLGAIVGIAWLEDVFTPDDPPPPDHEAASSPWRNPEAGYWLYFADANPVEPVPFKGKVGLFKVPYDIAAQLRMPPGLEDV
jgi:hypothetical protein